MVVGHREYACAGFARLLEQQIEDEGLVLRIEIARRLVGDHEAGARDQRPADGDTLLLALAECAGVPVELVGEPAGPGQSLGPCADLGIKRQRRGDPIWIEDVLACRQVVEQREILENEADGTRAEPPQPIFGQ